MDNSVIISNFPLIDLLEPFSKNKTFLVGFYLALNFLSIHENSDNTKVINQ